MRKIIATEYVSLDGVMETPEQWSFQFWADEIAKFKYDELFASGALLLGRTTYQAFASYWPSASQESDGATQDFIDRMNSLPKYVASTTLREVEWNGSLLKGDLADALAEAKRQDGQDILLYGSGELFRALLRQNLIDEYRLMLFPIVLGSGKRLFGDGGDLAKFTLANTKTFSSGVVVLTYEPAKRE